MNVTPESQHDFRGSPKESYGSTYFVWFNVLALSRPFGSVVLDATVLCDDEPFYEDEGSTVPLAVGQANGEIAIDVNECAGTWTRVTMSPRFPEWKCDGCGDYVQSAR